MVGHISFTFFQQLIMFDIGFDVEAVKIFFHVKKLKFIFKTDEHPSKPHQHKILKLLLMINFII